MQIARIVERGKAFNLVVDRMAVPPDTSNTLKHVASKLNVSLFTLSLVIMGQYGE